MAKGSPVNRGKNSSICGEAETRQVASTQRQGEKKTTAASLPLVVESSEVVVRELVVSWVTVVLGVVTVVTLVVISVVEYSVGAKSSLVIGDMNNMHNQ